MLPALGRKNRWKLWSQDCFYKGRVYVHVLGGQARALPANKTAATSLFGDGRDREIAIRLTASKVLVGGLLSRCARLVHFLFSIRP